MNVISFLITVFIGWPLALAILVLNKSSQGGLKRILGFMLCIIIGFVTIWLGWNLLFGGANTSAETVVTYPVLGFIMLCIGVIVGVAGTLRSLTIREEIDQIDFEEGISELIRGLFDIFLPYKKPSKKK